MDGYFSAFLSNMFKRIRIRPRLQPLQLPRQPIPRLYCHVKFFTQSGFTGPVDCVVDTGASRTVLPHDIWTQLDPEPTPVSQRPLAIGPIDELDVPVARVTIWLVDSQGDFELDVPAFLAPKPTPGKRGLRHVILGMEGLLCEAELYCFWQGKLAYMDFRVETPPVSIA
jgi:hypothetical protein